MGTVFAGFAFPQISLSAVVSGIASITPVGWVAIGVTAVIVTAVTVGVHYAANHSVTATESKTNAQERSQYPTARRNNYNTKKEAKEAAKRAGGGKPPKHHPKGCHGNKCSHYHPDVSATQRLTPHCPCCHDHYFYPG